MHAAPPMAQDAPDRCHQSKDTDAKLPRMSSDLITDSTDQDPELKDLAAAVLFRASHVPPSDGSLSLEAPSSLSFDVHQLVTTEEFKSSTPKGQLNSLMSLLFQANEDNFVLKAALQSTLDKLSATRDELQATKSELRVTLEQASLLLEEREQADVYDNTMAGLSQCSSGRSDEEEEEACLSGPPMVLDRDFQSSDDAATPISTRGLPALFSRDLSPTCILNSPSPGKSSEPSFSPTGLQVLVATANQAPVLT